MGFTPVNSESAGSTPAGDNVAGGSQRRVGVAGKARDTASSPTADRAVSMMSAPLLEDSAALGSSPGKGRLGDRRARAAMIGF